VCLLLADGSRPLLAGPPESRTYDGQTLDEWQERIKSLEFQSPAGASAVPGLMALVRDQDLPWYTRRQAALMLGRIGEPAAPIVPQLSDWLQTDASDADRETALWSAKALALFGPTAAPATSALIAVLRDESRDHDLRLGCLEALSRIGPAHPEAIPALMRILTGGPGDTPASRALHEASLDGLAFVGGAAALAVPPLIQLARHPDRLLRKKAVTGLGAIGPPAEVAVPAVVEVLIFDEFPDVQEVAATALSRIAPAGEAALRGLLTDPDGTVRRMAARGIANLPRAEPDTIYALRHALHDAELAVQLATAEAWNRLSLDRTPLLAVVLKGLTVEDRQLRVGAYRLLMELGPDARGLLPDLRRLEHDPRSHVRQAARKAIEQLSRATDAPAQEPISGSGSGGT
jgi:HEAT repeat protein